MCKSVTNLQYFHSNNISKTFISLNDFRSEGIKLINEANQYNPLHKVYICTFRLLIILVASGFSLLTQRYTVRNPPVACLPSLHRGEGGGY